MLVTIESNILPKFGLMNGIRNAVCALHAYMCIVQSLQIKSGFIWKMNHMSAFGCVGERKTFDLICH